MSSVYVETVSVSRRTGRILLTHADVAPALILAFQMFVGKMTVSFLSISFPSKFQ